MRAFCIGLLGLSVLVFTAAQAGDKKDDDKKPIAALPPHPLDSAFEKGNTERALTNGLLNNKLFEKAVIEALKAKREQEERFKKNPKLLDASPAQRARIRFLEVLVGEKPGKE